MRKRDGAAIMKDGVVLVMVSGRIEEGEVGELSGGRLGWMGGCLSVCWFLLQGRLRWWGEDWRGLGVAWLGCDVEDLFHRFTVPCPGLSLGGVYQGAA